MIDAIDVARYLIRLGSDPDAPKDSVFVGIDRLHKLLYFAQGWSLALLGRPIFHQSIVATSNGPRVSDLPAELSATPGNTLDFGPSEQRFLRMVWEEYIRFTPERIKTMFQTERSWIVARQNLPNESCEPVISLESLSIDFSERTKLFAQHGWPNPREVWEADEMIDRGESFSAKDVFGDIGFDDSEIGERNDASGVLAQSKIGDQ